MKNFEILREKLSLQLKPGKMGFSKPRFNEKQNLEFRKIFEQKNLQKLKILEFLHAKYTKRLIQMLSKINPKVQNFVMFGDCHKKFKNLLSVPLPWTETVTSWGLSP